MIEHGPSMDPLGRKPRMWEEEQRKNIRDAHMDMDLKEKARFLDIKSSAEGMLLISMVATRLEKRIAELIAADPMATAYSSIIKDMGYKDNIAKKAVAELYKRNLDQESHNK